jgi:hypothetical protein
MKTLIVGVLLVMGCTKFAPEMVTVYVDRDAKMCDYIFITDGLGDMYVMGRGDTEEFVAPVCAKYRRECAGGWDDVYLNRYLNIDTCVSSGDLTIR